MKRFVGFRALCLFGMAAAIFVAPGLAAPPTIVVGVKSIDELLDDAELVGSAAGHDGLRATADSAITGVTRGMGLAGVDQEKPLGVYWNMTTPAPNDIGKIVAFVPVSDVEAFQKLIAMFAPDFKDTDGQWSMTVGPMPLFAKMSDDYCFVSPSVEALANLPKPETLVDSKYDVAIDVNLGAIPKEAKAFFLKATEEGGRKSMAEGPQPKTDAEKAGQKIGFDGFLAALTSLTNDGDRITFGVNVDSETRLVSIDLGLTSKSNSDLAKTLTVYGKTTPAFAAVGPQDAPFRMVLSHPVAMTADKSKQLFDAMRKSTESEIDKDEKLKTDAEKKRRRMWPSAHSTSCRRPSIPGRCIP